MEGEINAGFPGTPGHPADMEAPLVDGTLPSPENQFAANPQVAPTLAPFMVSQQNDAVVVTIPGLAQSMFISAAAAEQFAVKLLQIANGILSRG